MRRTYFFSSIIADETSDVSKHEQFSVIVHFVENREIREEFVGFSHVTDFTGQSLADHLENRLQELKLDLQMWVGQGYDGAENMTGKFKGIQIILRNKYPLATHIHCSAHSLNLALRSASKLREIKDAMVVITGVAGFFSR